MTYTESQIEAIVQSVLRELSSRGVAVAGASGCASVADVKPTTAAGVEIGLNDRVITEELLTAHVAAGKVIVRPDAVITPSGHDFIRRSGIAVTRGSANSAKAAAGTVFAIGDCASVTAAAASVGWITKKAGCEFDAAEKSTPLVGMQPVVCCGGEASITACLLNRNTNTRAAVVNPTTDPARLIKKMNPQAICLNSAGWSFVDVTRLLRTLSDVSKAAPDKWKELPR